MAAWAWIPIVVWAAFSQTVRNPTAWRAFFLALQASPLPVRSQALEDITALLLRSGTNCDTLLLQPGWEEWIVPVLRGVASEDVAGARAPPVEAPC